MNGDIDFTEYDLAKEFEKPRRQIGEPLTHINNQINTGGPKKFRKNVSTPNLLINIAKKAQKSYTDSIYRQQSQPVLNLNNGLKI